MKLIKTLVMLLILAVTSGSFSFSLSFSDLEKYDWAKSSIINMQSKGYISGFPDGTFRPEAPVTRAQFVSIINKMNGFVKSENKNFTDVTSKHWAYSEIMKAVSAGYINGYPDGSFKPDVYITREQMAAMLNNLYHFEAHALNESIKDLSKISNWAVEAVVNVVSNGIMKLENGNFNGKVVANRVNSVSSLDFIVVSKMPTKSEWVLISKDIENQNNTTVPPILTPPISTTPIDSVTETSLKLVISRMENYVIPSLSTSSQVQVVNIIVGSIKTYLANPAYDMSNDVSNAKAIRSSMTSDQRDELELVIRREVPKSDLLRLNDKFDLIDTSKIEL